MSDKQDVTEAHEDEGRYLLWLKEEEREGMLKWIHSLKICDIPDMPCFEGLNKLHKILKDGPI